MISACHTTPVFDVIWCDNTINIPLALAYHKLTTSVYTSNSFQLKIFKFSATEMKHFEILVERLMNKLGLSIIG